MIKLNHIYCENCIRTMNRMPDNYIPLVITSPPYDNLRDYKGHEFTWTEFQNIVIGLHRVLKEGGVIVWVVADQTENGCESLTSFRQALFFKEIGFNIHDTMIYLKYGPSYSMTIGYDQIFEYMFIITKGKLKTFNPIKDRQNISSKWSHKNSKRQKDGSLKKGKVNRSLIPSHNRYGKRFNVWQIKQGYKVGSKDDITYLHPATFPEALAHDHIISWSNPGDVVYDPMMGSGTVAKMALLTGRKYIGSEIVLEDVQRANLRLSIIEGNKV